MGWGSLAAGLAVASSLALSTAAFATDAASTPDPGIAVREAAKALRASEPRVTMVRVDKSERRMWLMAGDRIVRSYRVSLGGNPIGPKRFKDDQRTPEGNYIINWRNPVSVAYRSMHISYPSRADKDYARKHGMSPGGDIMIHGQHNGIGWLWWMMQRVDWTNGCIGVANHEIDEIIAFVEPGTPIIIGP